MSGYVGKTYILQSSARIPDLVPPQIRLSYDLVADEKAATVIRVDDHLAITGDGARCAAEHVIRFEPVGVDGSSIVPGGLAGDDEAFKFHGAPYQSLCALGARGDSTSDRQVNRIFCIARGGLG